jgi:hypothetical protein
LAGSGLAFELPKPDAVIIRRAGNSVESMTNSNPSSPRGESQSTADFQEVIVTGRAGIEQRTKEETSYSVTTIDQKKLRLQGPTSVTESLKSVPGFWVEASGGEASGNVRARGIPVEQLLDRGYHLTGIGGSDNHDAFLPAASVAELRQPHDSDSPSPETLSKLRRNSGAIGTPTTVIYADALSQAGIVAAIRRGRVFIDVSGARDRTLDMTASVGKQTAHMGDTLVAQRDARVRFEGTVNGVAGGEAQVILDGRRVPLLSDSYIGSATKSFGFSWRADGKHHWIRLDVRDAESHLALIGNPIYLR